MIILKMIEKIIDIYAIFYPVVMSTIWIAGSLVFGMLQRNKHVYQFSGDQSVPQVSIIISMYNEAETIEASLDSLKLLNYPNYDVIVVDDKSTDHSVQKVKNWIHREEDFSIRLVELPENKGKASALNTVIADVGTAFIVVIDADSVLDVNALQQLMLKMSDGVGAVTGKPVVRNRTTSLGRLQTLEYMCVIDRIKRAQKNFLGSIVTVAGVIVLYRTSAIKKVGGFDSLAMTEDIDITWKLKKDKWKIEYSTTALSYILVPETIEGFFKQRTRWSVGGLEVFFKNIGWVIKSKNISYVLLLSDILLGHIWAWAFLLVNIKVLLVLFFNHTLDISGTIILIYQLLFLLIFVVSIIQDKKVSNLSFRDFFEVPYYCYFYWIGTLISAINSQFSVAFAKNTKKGKWDSPDRGR